MSSSKQNLKQKIQRQFGSLRAAAINLKISRWRLSSILNGWAQPYDEEKIKLQKIIKAEVSDV